jgi:hypothetical protein
MYKNNAPKTKAEMATTTSLPQSYLKRLRDIMELIASNCMSLFFFKMNLPVEKWNPAVRPTAARILRYSKIVAITMYYKIFPWIF